MTRINKMPRLIREILPRHDPHADGRGARKGVLNNITNYTGLDTYARACICTHPAENLEDSTDVRARFWCSVMNLYEALEGLRCPGARLCRCLNRNSGLLRSCGAMVRAGRHSWPSGRKGEKADRARG